MSAARFVAALASRWRSRRMPAASTSCTRSSTARRTAARTFKQTVTARSARAPQASSGTFAFARPGKFRWSYDKPFEQLVVGDGAKVWVYDKDLNQVIVRPLDAALGATPAALLAGDNALERNFTLVDGGDGRRPRVGRRDAQGGRVDVHEGPHRLPRRAAARDGAHRRVRPDDAPRVRRVRAQRRACAADLFRFTPPPGADVVQAPAAPK